MANKFCIGILVLNCICPEGIKFGRTTSIDEWRMAKGLITMEFGICLLGGNVQL